MINIPLQAIPNQNFSFQDTTTQVNYFITINTVGVGNAQVMAFDISIDGVVVVLGCRAVSGYPILASAYQQNGNFVMTTINDDLPDYRQFGITQYLIYANQTELDDITAAQALALLDVEALT